MKPIPTPAALWIAQTLLALVFTFTGVYKLITPIADIIAGLPYVNVYPPAVIRVLGGLEVTAAIALIVPRLIRVLPWLTPLAAVGLSLVMIGAMELHLRHANYPRAFLNIVLLTLTLFVVYGRGINPTPQPPPRIQGGGVR